MRAEPKPQANAISSTGRKGGFFDEGGVLPLQRARIFIRDGGHVHEAAEVLLAECLSKQNGEDLHGIEAIASSAASVWQGAPAC